MAQDETDALRAEVAALWAEVAALRAQMAVMPQVPALSQCTCGSTAGCKLHPWQWRGNVWANTCGAGGQAVPQLVFYTAGGQY